MRQATAEAEESVARKVTVNETGADAVNETEEEKTEEAFNEKLEAVAHIIHYVATQCNI